MIDPVTEKIWRVRESLIERAGGFDAYFDQLIKLDRKRLATEAAKKKSNRVTTAKKRSTAKPLKSTKSN